MFISYLMTDELHEPIINHLYAKHLGGKIRLETRSHLVATELANEGWPIITMDDQGLPALYEAIKSDSTAS